MQPTFLLRVFAAFVGAALIVISVPALPAGENYALLVAVSDYDPRQLHKLPYSRNDVVELHDLLLQSGFRRENVTLMHDDRDRQLPARLLPEAAKIRRQLTLMLAGRDEDDSLILAFAGHGVQFKGEDISYFCPLDADLERKETLISLREIYEAMKACPAKRKLLMVDACRNDPRTPVSRSRMTVDLESITRPQKAPVPESVVAFFSCAAGQKSFEWPELKHGVFFYHVLEVWKNGIADQQELTLDDLVQHTRKRTEAFTRKTLESVQTPELVGSSAGKWVLRTYPARILTNSIGMKLARIPAGEYRRGTPDADKIDDRSERPQHRVRITRDFHLGLHEVTRGEWKSVMGTEPWGEPDPSRIGDDYPVTSVSWNDAQEFCRRLSRTEGRPYRLPSEAEWEYASRAGAATRYSFGDDESRLGDYDWYGGLQSEGSAKSAPWVHRVGQKKPNAFGLFDMHGNVCEWCDDWFDADEYRQYADRVAVDPTGPPKGTKRAVRGGCWYFQASSCRAAWRACDSPDSHFGHLGFRVAATAPIP